MWSALGRGSSWGDHATLLAWMAGGLAVTGTGVAAALAAGGDDPVPWKPLLLTLIWTVPGVLIAAARPRMVTGWLLIVVAGFFVGIGLAEGFLAQASSGSAGAPWAIWYVDRASAFLVPCALLAVLLLPDGRFPAPAWRPIVAGVVGTQFVLVSAFCLVSGPAVGPDSDLVTSFGSLSNPVGVLPGSWAGLLDGVDVVVLQLPLLLVPLAFWHRLRRADPERKTALAVLLLGAAVFATLLVVGRLAWPGAADALDIAGSALLVVVVIGTVLGPRREIEYVVHQATVYVALTLVIASTYVGITSLAAAGGAQLPAWGAGTVAAVAALALLPVRTWWQRLVGRLLHGHRSDPYVALTRLAESTHHLSTVDEALAEVAASVATSLRVPFVQVRTSGAQATHGRMPARAVERSVPLLSGAEQVGTVVVASDPSRRWPAEDCALLAAIGRHGGMAVHAVGLAGSLRLSRQRLVEAREEERRLLGRNLHDGLGPTLASIGLQLGSLRGRQRTGSVEEAELRRLEEVAREALGELRRVARDLRPTVLDQHGLAGALQRHAESLDIELEQQAPADLDLPAAVEVAAYRIGQQALANVAAHAGVHTASLWISSTREELRLEVVDRGRGFAVLDEGVGLSSMRERAEELGGSCEVASGPAGTVVRAVLPRPSVGEEVLHG
ncbi:MAG: sensor histidine kinase [Nocardioides sp.]